jgi:hypothetical protein
LVIKVKVELGIRGSCLKSIILAIQEAEMRRIKVQSQCGQIVQETLSEKKKKKKNYHIKGLVEWLKVWALSSSPSTAKKKKVKVEETHKLCSNQNNDG